jgi:hypothetical protein
MDPVPNRPVASATSGQSYFGGTTDAEWIGKYYSSELETAYDLFLKDGKLMGRHFRHGIFALERTGEDTFRSGESFFPEIRFERNPQQKITGLRLSMGGAVQMYFEKQSND